MGRNGGVSALGNAVQYKAALVVGRVAAHTIVLPPYCPVPRESERGY